MRRSAFAFACLLAALPAAAQPQVPVFTDTTAWQMVTTADGAFRYNCLLPAACGEGARVIARNYPNVPELEPIAETIAAVPAMYFSADTGVNEVIMGEPTQTAVGFAVITRFSFELVSDPARANPLHRYWTSGDIYDPINKTLVDINSSSPISAEAAAANFDAMVSFVIGAAR